MLLVADVGNSSITLGIFEGENLVKVFRLIADTYIPEREYERMLSGFLKDYGITDCVIGSVNDELNSRFKQACDNVLGINSTLLDNGMEFGIGIAGEDSANAGMDRIANAVYAKKNCSLPAIIVDVGTAITLDVVSKEGTFIGGVIMPGINMALEALSEKTSKLPKIEPKESKKAIGDDTESCILSGVIRGNACAIDGLAVQIEQELGENVQIILTGGQAELVSNYMGRKAEINKNLTLEGLRIIHGNIKGE